MKSEVVDTENWSEDQLTKAYFEAVVPSVLHKQEIRRVFESRRNAAFLFGRQVPALIVYDEISGHPIEVYPHKERTERIEIVDYLKIRFSEVAGTSPTRKYDSFTNTLR